MAEINGTIRAKLSALDDVLGELRSLGVVTSEQLRKDWRTRRAIERDLQVLVEIVVDVCQRLLTLRGNVPAASGAEALRKCIDLGCLRERDGYARMVQFRNFIVHRYEFVDVNVLAEVVNRRLDDFEQFRDDVLGHVQRESG